VPGTILDAEERLDEDPNDVNALRRLAEALVAEGDHEMAHEVYVDLVRLRPDDATALLGLATAALELGDVPLARESAREAARLAPDLPEARRLLERLS
jgi:Flp pilus assembly protein TadD